MFRRALAAVGLFLMLISPLGASAQVTEGNVFKVDAKIYVGGILIGQPTVWVPAGAESAVALRTPRGYGLRFTVDNDATRPGVNGAIALASRIYFVNGSEWVRVGSPEVQTVLGATSRLSSNATTVYGPGGYTVEFTVSRSDRFVRPVDFAPVEDCPTWKMLADFDGTPLKGVTVHGEMVRTAAQVGPTDSAPYCCTAGSFTCCFSHPDGRCSDGEGNRCCAG